MNLLVRPKPMPEEWDRGYLGRVMRINGIRCESTARDYMLSMFKFEKNPPKNPSKLERLSLVAGLSLDDFVKHHLLLPIRIETVRENPYKPDVYPVRDIKLNDGWMTRIRPGAYFCSACVSEDVHLYGFSFWRRDHQIPGQWWCKNHSEPLLFDGNTKAHFASPLLSGANAQKIPKEFVLGARSNPDILKFLDVVTSLKKTNAVINRKTASEALRTQATKIGMCNFLGFFQPQLFSKIAAEVFPLHWLKLAFPDIFNESKGYGDERFARFIDQPMRYYSLWPFFLAASVLYENSDEAVFALTNSNQNSHFH